MTDRSMADYNHSQTGSGCSTQTSTQRNQERYHHVGPPSARQTSADLLEVTGKKKNTNISRREDEMVIMEYFVDRDVQQYVG